MRRTGRGGGIGLVSGVGAGERACEMGLGGGGGGTTTDGRIGFGKIT